VDTLRLKCPDCSTEFDFILPVLKYLEPGIKKDRAPARCPNGHINLYDLEAGS
jgi:hypothetical protein